jgi:hypothetical protein
VRQSHKPHAYPFPYHAVLRHAPSTLPVSVPITLHSLCRTPRPTSAHFIVLPTHTTAHSTCPTPALHCLSHVLHCQAARPLTRLSRSDHAFIVQSVNCPWSLLCNRSVLCTDRTATGSAKNTKDNARRIWQNAKDTEHKMQIVRTRDPEQCNNDGRAGGVTNAVTRTQDGDMEHEQREEQNMVR